jgi:elongation factor P
MAGYINATQLRVGMVFQESGELFRVTYVHHVTPGNKRGFVQSKFRSLSSGTQYDRRFSSEDRVERVVLEKKDMEYLYESQNEFFFMDVTTHDQVSMVREKIGDIDKYMSDNQHVGILFHDGKALSVELPAKVDLVVEKTVPGIKRATATNSTKPATCETGLILQVPQFINEGDKIRVDTSSGAYIERVKK